MHSPSTERTDTMPKKLTITLHDMREEQPQRSTDVLYVSFSKDGLPYSIGTTRYSVKHKCFCCGDETPEETVEERRPKWNDVRFWAYLYPINKRLEKAAAE